MVLYKCEHCFYQTKDKNKYYRHLNRKFSCKEQFSAINSKEKSLSVPQTFQGVPNEQKKVLPVCKWCHKTFSRQPNLNKHLKYGHCMIKRQWLISMDLEYQRLLKEMKENQSKMSDIDKDENKDEVNDDEQSLERAKLTENIEKCILED